eukprot:scaffold196205_cov19-Tisochrysis_lutea.AAC.2
MQTGSLAMAPAQATPAGSDISHAAPPFEVAYDMQHILARAPPGKPVVYAQHVHVNDTIHTHTRDKHPHPHPHPHPLIDGKMLHVLLCESSKPCRVLACRLYCVCMLCTWLPGSPLGCPPASQHPFPSTQSSTATTHLYTALMVNKVTFETFTTTGQPLTCTQP